ncbi:uncharacterized protein [Dysidea avara]|uniref:uncharacterized protein n=1 Tax=Dysidea avara TaxID=196820 RepID=UPI00332CBA65
MFFVIILSNLLIYTDANCETYGTICSSQPNTRQPLCKQHNDTVSFLCNPDVDCSGEHEFVFERNSQGTNNYDEIQKGWSYQYTGKIHSVTDGGNHRCQKRCRDGSANSTYCYLTIQVMPPTIEMNFPPTTKHTNYIGTCTATGNPTPVVQAKLNIPSTDCPYTTSYTNVSMYTGQVVLTIPHVTTKCHNATVYCSVRCRNCRTQQSSKLNVTELSLTEGALSTDPDNTPEPTTPLPGRGSTNNINFLMIFILVIIVFSFSS